MQAFSGYLFSILHILTNYFCSNSKPVMAGFPASPLWLLKLCFAASFDGLSLLYNDSHDVRRFVDRKGILAQVFNQTTLLAMSHQWTADDFCNKLVHVANLLTKRPNSQVGQAALQPLKQRLTSVNDLTASTLSLLYDKVGAADLPGQLKEDIMQTMDNLAVQQEPALEVSAKPNSLHNLPPYLATGDWQKLQESHMLDNMRIISERLKKLGIKKLKD